MSSRKRHIRVRGVRREQPDIRRLSRAIIELAQAQIEAEAQAEHRRPGHEAGTKAQQANPDSETSTDGDPSLPPQERP